MIRLLTLSANAGNFSKRKLPFFITSMIGFFITIFILAWKITFLLIAGVFLIFLIYWLLGVVGILTQPFVNFLLAPFKLLGIKTWKERKQEYKQGKEPNWFDKINLWIEGNEKQ